MSVNDLGYRKWEGQLRSPYLRWLTIALSGIKIVYKSQWIKRLMFIAWAPTLAAGVFFFGYEQYVQYRAPDSQSSNRGPGLNIMRAGLNQFASPDQANLLMESLTSDPTQVRGKIWAFILYQMLRYTQGGMVLLLIGMIAPPLISKDIRSRAFLFYFSKPISRTDYLLGKFSVVAFFVAFVTLFPLLALYLFGILLSPTFGVILSTWYLPFQILGASLISIVPCCLIGLALSSVTSESRFAGFAWFMVWILGSVGFRIVASVSSFGPDGRMHLDNFESMWRVVSLYDCITYLQSWIMGLESNHGYAMTLLLLMSAICAFCIRTILRKISAPLKS